MINVLLGKKIEMSACFDEKGNFIPVTLIQAGPCPVTAIKTSKKDRYWAVQIGFGEKKPKRVSKPISGHLKKAGIKTPPRFLREVRTNQEIKARVRDIVGVGDVFKKGDFVAVTGTSKGKGFAGVMKRWGFAGGPATRGQSDRARHIGSPGAEGPGHIFPGKKMPGRMGNRKVTVTGLTIMDVDSKNNLLVVKGAVPGPRGGLLVIKKTGKAKKFVPLLKKEKEEKKSEEGKKGEVLKHRKKKTLKSKVPHKIN